MSYPVLIVGGPYDGEHFEATADQQQVTMAHPPTFERTRHALPQQTMLVPTSDPRPVTMKIERYLSPYRRWVSVVHWPPDE